MDQQKDDNVKDVAKIASGTCCGIIAAPVAIVAVIVFMIIALAMCGGLLAGS